jgi:hypothetical protein
LTPATAFLQEHGKIPSPPRSFRSRDIEEAPRFSAGPTTVPLPLLPTASRPCSEVGRRRSAPRIEVDQRAPGGGGWRRRTPFLELAVAPAAPLPRAPPRRIRLRTRPWPPRLATADAGSIHRRRGSTRPVPAPVLAPPCACRGRGEATSLM